MHNSLKTSSIYNNLTYLVLGGYYFYSITFRSRRVIWVINVLCVLLGLLFGIDTYICSKFTPFSVVKLPFTWSSWTTTTSGTNK